ncbi:MAG: hypothetical protein RLZZ123_857 [Pseudomonadota bacterium]|jgi:uncharacterized protein (DUF1330 family)
MPCAYIIANVRVTNPEQYAEYRQWSSAAFEAHQVEVLVRGGHFEVMEGDWVPDRLVLLRFPSVAAAQAFYDSPEYGKARVARENAAVMRMVVVEGV